MRKYYNDKKYFVKRALKIAKKCNNQKAILTLDLLERQQNVFPVSFIQKINKMDIAEVNLFKIENKD